MLAVLFFWLKGDIGLKLAILEKQGNIAIYRKAWLPAAM